MAYSLVSPAFLWDKPFVVNTRPGSHSVWFSSWREDVLNLWNTPVIRTKDYDSKHLCWNNLMNYHIKSSLRSSTLRVHLEGKALFNSALDVSSFSGFCKQSWSLLYVVDAVSFPHKSNFCRWKIYLTLYWKHAWSELQKSFVLNAFVFQNCRVLVK